MPKIPDISPVDIEARKRMEEGVRKKLGNDKWGTDEDYAALLRLCRIANVDPVFHTYEEIDRAIQAKFVFWRDKAKLLGGNTNEQRKP